MEVGQLISFPDDTGSRLILANPGVIIAVWEWDSLTNIHAADSSNPVSIRLLCLCEGVYLLCVGVCEGMYGCVQLYKLPNSIVTA